MLPDPWPVPTLKMHFLGRTGLIIGLYGVVFRGEDARDVQKCVAPQHDMKNLTNLQKIWKKSERLFFERQKNEMGEIV